MKKPVIIALAAILALSAAGCSQESAADAPAEGEVVAATAVETVIVKTGSVASVRELSGKVEADADVAVMAPLPVKVISLNVREGDAVREGDVLFVLDKTDVEKQYGPLRDSYERTKTVSEETLRQLRQNVEDTQALYDAGFASLKELEGAKLQLMSQQAQIDTTLDTLSTNMDNIETTLADASVKAPTAGLVTTVAVVEDGTASAMQPSIVISRTDSVTASFGVSENMLSYLYAGQPVTVTASATGTVYEASITTISAAASPMTQLYAVKVAIDNPEGALRSGMFVTASLESERRSEVVTLPSAAIVAMTDGNVVFAVENGVAREIPVETGLVSGDMTEITAGLAGGEEVVVKGQTYLEDGDAVRVVAGQGD